VLLILAIFKGYTKGFIVAIFSTISIFIGLLVALKLSAVTANYLQQSNIKIPIKWLPFLSFMLVVVATIILVRVGSAIIEKTVEFALMGWLNKIAGIALYILLHFSVLSILLFYLIEMNLLSANTVQQSKTYFFIQPIAPKAIQVIGSITPMFKNIFEQLEIFFSSIASNA
ncbi:MAG TPA: CvpA family protein, partial [Chitinophagaceae bacterium]|nr:CvpA family protein [Chitinophagaceae bacterium]